MPSRCWDPQDTLYLPVELLVKSKACPSFLALSQGIFVEALQVLRGRCWGSCRVLGDTRRHSRCQGCQQGARMSSGYRGYLPGSGMSTGTGMTGMSAGDSQRCQLPRSTATQVGAHRCRGVSRCRCRAVAGLWCHLVGCRLPAPPVWRGQRATPARGTPGQQPRSGPPDRALHLPLLPYAAPPWPVLPLFASFAAPQRLRVAVLFLLERAGAFRKGLSEQLVSQRMPPDPPTGRAGGLSSSSGRQRAQQESLCPH